MNDVKLFYILVQAANNGMYKVLHVDAVPFTNSLIALRDSIHERLQVLGIDREKSPIVTATYKVRLEPIISKIFS